MDNLLNMDFFESSGENELDSLFSPEELEEEVKEGSGQAPQDDLDKSIKDKQQELGEAIEKKLENVAEEEEEEDNQDNESGNLSDMYSSLAKLLAEDGLLSSSLDIKDKEGFIEAFKGTIKEAEYSDLSDIQKRYLESIRDGVSEDTFLQYESNNASLENISDIDIENEENQQLREDLIKQGFLMKNFSEEKASKWTQKIVESGEDIEEAKEALDAIKKFNQERYTAKVEEAKQAKVKQKQQEETQLNAFKDKVDSTSELIKGNKLNKNLKDKIVDAYTKVAGYTEEGVPYNKIAAAQMKDPVDFQFKLAYLFELTEGFNNFDALTTKKAAKSTAERELANILKKTNYNEIGGISTSSDEESFGVEDFKDLNLDL